MNIDPKTLITLMKQCFLAWPRTLKSLLPFIVPLAVVKTAYLVLFLKATQTIKQQWPPFSTTLALLLIAVIAAYLLGCCFFNVFYQQQKKTLSASQTVIMMKPCSIVYLSTWFLCGLLSLSGTMLFVLPGIIIYLYTKYAKFIALFESVNTMQALSQSVQLIAKQAWRVFVIEFFILAVSFVGLIIAQYASTLLLLPFGGHITSIIGQFLTVLCIQIIVVPLIVHVQVAQYMDLKQRRQAKQYHSNNTEEETTVIC